MSAREDRGVRIPTTCKRKPAGVAHKYFLLSEKNPEAGELAEKLMTEKPKRPRHSGGRPRHQPTAAARRAVEGMAASAVSQRAIAEALGIDRATLARRYQGELLAGHARCRAAAIRELFRAARAGKVSAMIRILAATDRAEGDVTDDPRVPSHLADDNHRAYTKMRWR